MQAVERFRKIVLDNLAFLREDFRAMAEEMEKSEAKYHGEVIDHLYQPFFFDDFNIRRFEKNCNLITAITYKLTRAYLEKDELRHLFVFDRTADELIRIEPCYTYPVPIGPLRRAHSKIAVRRITPDSLLITLALRFRFFRSRLIRKPELNYHRLPWLLFLHSSLGLPP